MRWTNSDLIIEPAAPCSSPFAFAFAMVMVRSLNVGPAGSARSIGQRRVPKGQQTVKIEPLYGPDRAPLLQTLRERAKAPRFERNRRCEMQHRQIAKARFELPVAHRGVGLQAFLLGEPVDRALLVADLVDELELKALT